MIAAVVPVHMEEYRVGRVLASLLSLNTVSRIFVILNGSNELTAKEVQHAYAQHREKIVLVSFAAPLGIDIPRAVGARLAYAAGADYTVFVDGDMVGEITTELEDFIGTTMRLELDLALLDCYPDKTVLADLTQPLFYWRALLNRELGLFAEVNIATPSHGFHAVSRRMLRDTPWNDFAVPPTLLTHAVRLHYRTGIAGTIPHAQLGSSVKNVTHNRLIVDTIIGDCIEALCLWQHRPRMRSSGDKVYIGYHDRRRFDLLQQFLAGLSM
ncbi:MAG TPA: glycosyltransferase family 2 protein [Firmicutes bacterium]|nr:glycosyltransferase family 2 protein [Bacillota bacterium]